MTVIDRPPTRTRLALLPCGVGLAVAAVLVADGLQHRRLEFGVGLLLFLAVQLALPTALFRLTRDRRATVSLSVGLFGVWAGGVNLAGGSERPVAVVVLVLAVALLGAGVRGLPAEAGRVGS